MSKRPSLAESMKNVADEQGVQAKAPNVQRFSDDASAPKGRARSRIGKKLILVPLDPQLHLQLRHRALDEGRTVEAFVQAAIAAYLSKPASMP
jgi:hypothetical protein